MRRQVIDVSRTVHASSDAIWRLLGDSSTWPSWTPIDDYQPVRPAGTNGEGEVRAFRNGRYLLCEEVVERCPPQRLSYILLSGLPLRHYRADIDLTPVSPVETTLRWHTVFEPKVPGSGWLFRRALDAATREFVDGLARAAEATPPRRTFCV